MKMQSFLASLLLGLCVPLLAQQAAPAAAPLTAAAFMPPDYQTTAFVDFKQLREREIWDELQRSALGLLFAQMEKEARRVRNAVGNLASLAAPLFVREADALGVEVLPPAPPPPPPAPPGKEPGKDPGR